MNPSLLTSRVPGGRDPWSILRATVGLAVLLVPASASLAASSLMGQYWVEITVETPVPSYEVSVDVSSVDAVQGPGDLEEICTVNSDDTPDGCWIEVSNIPGCHVWNPHPAPNETYSWTGVCENGSPSGNGTGIWRYQNDEGEWKESSHEGSYVDGKMHGHWVELSFDGTFAEGLYVDDKRHGRWMVKWLQGGGMEGPFVDGEQHGHWVYMYPDGTVEEGPYADGERYGHWVEKWANGDVHEGPYVNGERDYDRWVSKWADSPGFPLIIN